MEKKLVRINEISDLIIGETPIRDTKVDLTVYNAKQKFLSKLLKKEFISISSHAIEGALNSVRWLPKDAEWEVIEVSPNIFYHMFEGYLSGYNIVSRREYSLGPKQKKFLRLFGDPVLMLKYYCEPYSPNLGPANFIYIKKKA